MIKCATACGMTASILSAVFYSGCDINSYTPTSDKLRSPENPSGAFIVNEEDIRGIYGNMDVDSCIYQYTTTEADVIRFWEAVDARSTKAGWKLVHEERNTRHYDRIRPAVGQQVNHSAEQVRVAYEVATRTVTVAWVQVDVRVSRAKPPTEFPKADHSEVGFADDEIWPRFEKLVSHQ